MKQTTKISAIYIALVVLSISSFAQNSRGHGKSFYTSEEVKRMCGVPVDTAELRRGIAKQDSMYKEYISNKKTRQTKLSKTETTPNWRGMMSPVEYQGDDQCDSSCWAHAASGVVEGQLHILQTSNIGIDLDENSIVYNGRGSCGGDFPTTALNYIQNSKSISEVGSYPNLQGVRWGIVSKRTISSIDTIKKYLAYGPVTACFDVYDDFSSFFYNYPTGVYHYNGYSAYDAGHAVVIVSYDDNNQYWLCKNSWGDWWADNGYFRIGYGQCRIESWENSVVTVDQSCYAKIVPNLINSLNTAFGYGFVNNEWVQVLSSVTVSGNLTIPSGTTMSVSSGSSLTFNGYYKLRVEGALSAYLATFQGSGYPGSWFGIEFYNATSSQDLGYSTIKDAEYGLNFINTDVAFSSPRIRDNTYGVNFTNYSDPTFTAAVFQTNGFGAYGDASSCPYLGSYIGYNSFRYNDYYDVYSTYSGTVFARGNWWGACPPYPSVTQNVDYSSWLCTDPNPRSQMAGDMIGMPLSKAAMGLSSELPSGKATGPAPEPGISELDAACLLYADGKYAEGLHAFEAIVAGYPDNFAGPRALVFVERTLDRLGRSNEILARLNTASASYSGKALGEFADARRVYQYLNQGRYQDAVAQAAEVVRLNDDTTLVKFALYDLGSICWYYLGDTKTGEQYYRELIARFPKDHLTNSALATLGEWKPEEQSGKAGDASLGQSKEPPTQYALTQNYPNPFNPSTVISYQLPTGGYVTLKLYNTLGQEVATLVDGIQDAGFKSVTFDASQLPSGVYFYRLQAGAIVQNRKMLLVK